MIVKLMRRLMGTKSSRKSRVQRVNVLTSAVRRFRKKMQAKCREGIYSVRLVGHADVGYQLGAHRGNSIILFSRVFSHQAEAVAWSEEHLGRKPIKFLGNRQAA